jgi:hypothetical protein
MILDFIFFAARLPVDVFELALLSDCSIVGCTFICRFDAPVARMALSTPVVAGIAAGAAALLLAAVLVAAWFVRRRLRARRDRSSDTGSSEAPPTLGT